MHATHMLLKDIDQVNGDSDARQQASANTTPRRPAGFHACLQRPKYHILVIIGRDCYVL